MVGMIVRLESSLPVNKKAVSWHRVSKEREARKDDMRDKNGIINERRGAVERAGGGGGGGMY